VLHRAYEWRSWLTAGLVITLTAVIWLVYSPGLTASYYFDDAPNLIGLEQVTDSRSALEFTLSGQSGPTGRPLALASFLLNTTDWPENPNRLRRVNVLIHIINALLVVWLAFRLARAGGTSHRQAESVALIAGSAWSLLPVLVSTSMMITQRMTSLAALFVLLGLLVFVSGYQRLGKAPLLAMAAMATGLIAFTTLATLCKENGALLPVYALAITVLLPSPDLMGHRVWRIWKLLFLWLPLLLITAFLGSRYFWSEATVLMRGFDAWERLMTQARLLWLYLFNSLLPMSSTQFGPFHDNLTPSRSILEPFTLAAAAAWIACIWIAVAVRRKLPVLSFSIFWFLGGHLLESTVIPLDLYFEHRNYLPLVGPAIGLGWLVISVPRKWTRLAAGAVLGYIGLIGWTTASIADEWGSPLQFAEEQYRGNRDSPRAAGFFASHLLAINRPELALVIIDQAIARGKDAPRLHLASIPIRCAVVANSLPDADVKSLASMLQTAQADRNLARALHDFLEYSVTSSCPTLAVKDMKGLIESLSANKNFARLAGSRYWIHRSRALVASRSGNHNQQRVQLSQALRARFDPYALELLIQSHLRYSQTEPACARLRHLWKATRANPLRKYYVGMVLDRMADKINAFAPKEKPCHPTTMGPAR